MYHLEEKSETQKFSKVYNAEASQSCPWKKALNWNLCWSELWWMDTTRGSNSAFLFSQALHHSPADSVSKIPMCKKSEQPGGCLHDNLIRAVLVWAQSPVLSRVCKLQPRAVVGTELPHGGEDGTAPSCWFATLCSYTCSSYKKLILRSSHLWRAEDLFEREQTGPWPLLEMTQQRVASLAVLAGNTRSQQLANQLGWVYFEFCPYMDLSLEETVFLVK